MFGRVARHIDYCTSLTFLFTYDANLLTNCHYTICEGLSLCRPTGIRKTYYSDPIAQLTTPVVSWFYFLLPPMRYVNEMVCSEMKVTAALNHCIKPSDYLLFLMLLYVLHKISNIHFPKITCSSKVPAVPTVV